MRIVGGKARGCRLKSPARNLKIRPTSDKVRESLFNMIDVEGKTFLDLFAGTGAVGCEAVSRGAREVTMVDDNASSIGIIINNLGTVEKMAGKSAKVYIKNSDALKFAKKVTGKKFDIVFCDPPYDWAGFDGVARYVIKNLLSKSGGEAVFEVSSKNIPDLGIEPEKIRQYGDTSLIFYSHVD